MPNDQKEVVIEDADIIEPEFTPDELADETTDWKAKALELKGLNQRRATKLKKAKEALAAKTEIKPSPAEKIEIKPDDKLLGRLDKMALQIADIKEADEVELFNKWKTDTGREADDILGNNIFKKELEDIRTAKANQVATSEIKGGGDKSGGVQNTPEYWIAKATKGKDGKLEFPEEMPKEVYSKVLNKLSEGEPNSSGNLKFYNEK